MGLGLSITELEKLFTTQYTAERDKLGFQWSSIRSGFEIKAIPEPVAEQLTHLAALQIASWKSLLTVITKNNSRIEAQLKAKGINV